jgi:serine protease DegS
VLALGNPYGLARSVSFGIVSGNGRVLDLTTYEDYIQTDAAINPGNSGGALLDLDGAVVGINTAKGTRFDGSLGLGFAIPAYLVREVVPELDRSGHVRRGWLGVQFRPLSLDGARDLGLALPGYVAIDRVIAGGPAESAGLETDDVILRVDGQAVTDGQGLLMAVARLEPGTSAALEILRDGERAEVSVQVGERALDER